MKEKEPAAGRTAHEMKEAKPARTQKVASSVSGLTSVCALGSHAAVVPALPSSTNPFLQHRCSTGKHCLRLQQGTRTGNTRHGNMEGAQTFPWTHGSLVRVLFSSRRHQCPPMGITVPTCRPWLSTTPSLQRPTRPMPTRCVHTTHQQTFKNVTCSLWLRSEMTGHL